MWCRSGAEWTVNANIDRLIHPARGADGGESGAPGRFCDQSGCDLPSKQHIRLDPDQVVDLDLPGGGGWGDPFTRPEEEVLADVVEGYVSVSAARSAYGVVVHHVGHPGALVRLPRHYRIDHDATRLLRAAAQPPTGGQTDQGGERSP